MLLKKTESVLVGSGNGDGFISRFVRDLNAVASFRHDALDVVGGDFTFTGLEAQARSLMDTVPQ